MLPTVVPDEKFDPLQGKTIYELVPDITEDDIAYLHAQRPRYERVNAALRLRGQGNMEEALAAAKAVMEVDPRFGPGIDAYVEVATSAKRLDDAGARFGERSVATPADWTTWYGLAKVRLAQKEYEEALRAGQRAIDAECDYWGCFSAVAGAFEGLKQVEEGGAYFRELIAGAGGDSHHEGLAWLGFGDLLDGDPIQREGAVAALKESAELLQAGRGWEESHFRQGSVAIGKALYREANELYATALVVYREAGNQSDEARCLGNMAIACCRIRDASRAVQLNGQALAIYRNLGNVRAEAKALGTTAQLHMSLGEVDLAIHFFQQALHLSRAVSDRRGEASHLNNLGLAYTQRGELHAAVTSFELALELNRIEGNRADEGSVLGNLGRVLVDMGEFSMGEQTLQQALAIHREMGRRQDEGAVLNNLGLAYLHLADPSKALGLFREALAIQREVRSQSGEASTLSNIGNVHWALGNWEQALEAYTAALDLYRAAGDRGGEATVLGNFGTAYCETGQPERSIDFLSQALSLHREVANKRGEGEVLGWLGACYRDLGQPLVALRLLDLALAIDQNVHHRIAEALTLANLGLTYTDLGEPLRGAELLERALTLQRELGDSRGEATVLSNLAITYNEMGDHAHAIQTYEQALSLNRDNGASWEEGVTLGNLAVAHHDSGNPIAALQFYQRGLAVDREVGNLRSEAILLTNLGNAQLDLGDLSGALESQMQAREIVRHGASRDVERQILVCLARSLALQGRRGEATISLAGALQLDASVGTQPGDVDLESSYFAQDTRAYPLEIRLLTSALPNDPAPLVTPEVLTHTFTQGEVARSRNYHRRLQTARIDPAEGAPPDVLSAVREASFQLQQAQNLLNQRESSPSERYALQNWLSGQLAPYLERQRLTGGELPPTALELERRMEALVAKTLASDERKALLEDLLKEREQALAQAERHLRDATPAYKALVEPRLATLEEVQEALDPDTLMITYLLGEDESFAWVVTHEGTHLLHLPREKEITSAVGSFRSLLNNPESIVGGGGMAASRAGIVSAARELAMTLGIDRSLAHAPGANRLVIVADGSLGGLPFEVLVAGSGEGAGIGDVPPWLGLSHTITYAPSATVWWQSQVEGHKTTPESLLGRPLLMVADPIYHEDACGEGAALLATRGADTRAGLFNESWSRLCASGGEANRVTRSRRSLFGRPDDIAWLGADASEQAFRAEDLSRFSILHFATHAKAYEDVPLRSAIVLSQQNLTSIGESSEVEVGDGYLDMREISKLKLNADLVVLSGCDTAQGRKRPGEGVESLARAFLMAGARQVVASQWQVADESTSRFMARFYEEMREAPPDEALARTKQAFMRGEEGFEVRGPDGKKVQVEWSHPYYWAPFILMEGGQLAARE